jgi:chemotaxis protein methyltransferase CheR
MAIQNNQTPNSNSSAPLPLRVATPSTQGESLISDTLLAKYGKLIYDTTGIRISPQKKAMLSNRLRRRLRATGLPDFEKYFDYIQKLPLTNQEWDEFLQEITTHETYLFRDELQWDWFQKQFLPEFVGEANTAKRPRSLRVWSAACSTGDEAYTVATCIAAAIPALSQWKVKIVGTDIGIGAVRHAQQAQFNARAMRLVPEELKAKFFVKQANEPMWQPKPALLGMTEFIQHNLLEPLRQPPFDLVILKNVLIYFDEPSKLKVLTNIRKAIAPGGLLVAGVAEGVSDLVKDLQRLQPWLYRATK